MAEDGMELEEPSKETNQESAVLMEPELPSEFEKLFKACEENPEDFNGWVYLLQYVEQEVREEDYSDMFSLFISKIEQNKVKSICVGYDLFLSECPCSCKKSI